MSMNTDQIKADFQELEQKLQQAQQIAYKHEEFGGSGLEEDIIVQIQNALDNLDRVRDQVLDNFQNQ